MTANHPPVAYRLQLFGIPQVADATGVPIAAGKRIRGVLCYLALAQDRHATRERLSSLFWEDRGSAQARASLRQALLELRGALPPDGPDLLIVDRHSVAIDASHVEIDLEAAEAATSPDDLLQILQRIGAQIPLDIAFPSVGFGEWRSAILPIIEGRLRAVLLRQLDAAEASGNEAAVVALADAWRERSPLDEMVVGRAIAAEVRSGNRDAGQRRYQQLAYLLETQRGAVPSRGVLDQLEAPGVFGPAPRPAPRAEDRPSADPAAKVPVSGQGEGRPEHRGSLRRKIWRIAAAFATILGIAVAGSYAVSLNAPAAERNVPVVAVLPFQAENGSEEDRVFAEGLADEVMNGLAEDPQVRVIGRATAAQLNKTAALRKKAYQRLGVTRFLTGTIRYGADHSGLADRLGLIDSRTGKTDWASTVHFAGTEVASAEQELTALVARQLLGRSDQRQSAARPDRLDPGAYRNVVLARRHIQSREGNRLIEARELARQAVEIAPQWAEAHAARSTAASLMQNYTNMPVAPLLAEAGAAAAQALSLDPELAAGHEAQSLALEGIDADQTMAAASRAVLLRPGNAEARRRLAWLLRADGQHRQAISELEAAIRIDPLWYLPYIDLGISLAQTNEPRQLIASQQRHAALDPPPGERDLVLANMLLDIGRAGEAATIADRLVRTEPLLTYASLTAVDARMALFAADSIATEQFELNTAPATMALARGDIAGAARAAGDMGTGVWDDPEAAVVLGHALMSQNRPAILHTALMKRYPSAAAYARRPAQVLALGRHPGLYVAQALAASGDKAGAAAIRQKVAADIARLETLGLARSQSGVTAAALALIAGDQPGALDRLESALSAQWPAVCHGPIWIGTDPLFRGLVTEARFTALLTRCREQLNRQRAAAGLPPLTLR